MAPELAALIEGDGAPVPGLDWRLLYPAAVMLFALMGFTLLKIPRGFSHPAFVVPAFVSVVLSYGLVPFVWLRFGMMIAAATLATSYILAECAALILPRRVLMALIYVLFVGGVVCTDYAVHLTGIG